MRLDTLRARVVTWYAGMLAAALLVFGATLYLGVQGYLRASLQHSLAGDAQAIGATFLAFEEQKGQPWMAGEITEAYAPELSGRFIRITRRDGAVLYQSGDTRDPVIDASAVLLPNFNDDTAHFHTERQPGSNDLLLYTLPFRSSSEISYLIETGSSVAPIQRVLSSLRRILTVDHATDPDRRRNRRSGANEAAAATAGHSLGARRTHRNLQAGRATPRAFHS